MSVWEMIEASATAAVICDPRLPDTPIIACNAAFERLTGYGSDEILGRNCRFLRGAGTETAATEQLRQGIAHGQPVLVELLNYRKDGTVFRNAVMIAPLFDEQGKVEYFLGSQMEVADASLVAVPTRRDEALRQIGMMSKRQREVLRLMAAGNMNKQIAYELGIGERTVKMHRAELLKALGVRTSADAIRLAVEAGL